jgi:HTH-type transcriptional regulator/antitoxin HigA
MKLKPLKTKKDYEILLDWVDQQFDKKIKVDSPEGEQLQIALLLIKQYEDAHYTIPTPDPIEAIKIKMEEKGMKSKDLIGIIGSKGYISSLLNRKKPLTLEIARIFHKRLGISADILLS